LTKLALQEKLLNEELLNSMWLIFADTLIICNHSLVARITIVLYFLKLDLITNLTLYWDTHYIRYGLIIVVVFSIHINILFLFESIIHVIYQYFQMQSQD